MRNRVANRLAANKERPHTSPASAARAFFDTLKSAGTQRGPAVGEFCATYGVTQEVFTRLTGFSPRAVAHWTKGRKPSTSTSRRLAELNRIFEALGQLAPKKTIGPWLKAPNPAFDGSTPLQVIERGETDRIWRMIYELQSGEPG